MVFTYSQRDTVDDTEDKFSDLISSADDKIREKYNEEAELINDDFLLHQLTDNDAEDVCTNDTETDKSEEEVSVTKVSSSSDLTSDRIELLYYVIYGSTSRWRHSDTTPSESESWYVML